MKITGTKKLLIIFFALMCAFAAATGVIITRGFSAANAQVEYVAPDGAADENTQSEEEVNSAIDADAQKESKEEIEEAEEEYDARFDEQTISEIAEIFDLDVSLVRMYCHVKDVDARTVLDTLIVERQRAEENAPKSALLSQAEMEEYASQPNLSEGIYEDIANFGEAYINGEIELKDGDEQEDWYVAPDDAETLFSGSWYMIKYTDNTYGGRVYIYVENMNGTSSSDQWTDITAQVATAANVRIYDAAGNNRGLSNSTMGRYQSDYITSTSAPAYYLYRDVYNGVTYSTLYQCGYKYTVTLEPGQKLMMQYYSNADSGSNKFLYGHWGSYNGSYTHFQTRDFYAGTAANTSTWSTIIVDGDAPTGFDAYIGKGGAMQEINGHWGKRYTWYSSAGAITSTTNGNYLNRSSITWTYWIDIVRKDPPKPDIVQEAGVSGNTKTAIYEGDPVTISMYPDFGASALLWSAGTNAAFSQVDETVTLKSRSDHGKEPTYANGFTKANLTLQSSAAGTHYIKLESPTGRWYDGSTGAVTFILVVKTQEAVRPSMKVENGVSPNGKEKTLNYTGEELTITFINVDKKLISYVAPAMTEESWDEATKTLVLKQKERGKYVISLAIANPAGCVWKDTKTTESLQFTFYIKEMLIDKPVVTEWPTGNNATHSGNTCEVDYDGTEKTLKIKPAYEEQLIIIAAGLKYDFVDEDPNIAGNETCVFRMTNSDTQTITIMPNEGYMWKDKTKTQISLTITIRAVAVDFPRLAADPAVVGKVKTVTFDPTPGWIGTIVIENIPKDAIIQTSALSVVSWVSSTNKENPTDFDLDLLTLGASAAQSYAITFALSNSNYRWKQSGTTPPTFMLVIDRYALDMPKINEPASSAIDGLTKTVYYNSDASIGQPVTAPEDRFFKLFVGGFTNGRAGLALDAGQIDIRYTKDSQLITSGLREDWTDETSSINDTNCVPNLTLWGDTAGNYIIDITPTSNYKWTDGTNDMKTFKFVVTPIFHDRLEMFVKQDGSTAWIPVDRNGTVLYTGEPRQFRIGNEKNATEYFIANEMEFEYVGDDLQPAPAPAGFVLNPYTLPDPDTHGNPITVLEGSVLNAGVYTIRLKLKNDNYAWRDGSGVDIYYTLTVTAESLGTPKILADECSGGQNLMVYDQPTNNFITAGYNGNDITMVINVKKADSIIRLDFDPDGNDAGGIRQESWGPTTDDNLDRLILKSVNVGIHKVRLYIDDPNYRWDNDASYYEFRIVVDYADVDDIVFNYGSGEAMTAIGGNNSMLSKTFDVETTHQITVTRSTEEFATTPFKTQFTFQITYNKPGYTYKADAYTDDSLVLDFHDANVYYINIYLTSNYRWKTIKQVGAAMRMIFEVRPKTVAVPAIIDEGEKNEDGSNAAAINQLTREKSITYDSKTSQSIALDYGNDYRAYQVDTALTSPFLKKDNTISILDKKVRYTAKSAGSYAVALTLTDTNNYVWSAPATVNYTLKIIPRSISVPDAYFIHAKDIVDVNLDYLDIQNSKGELIIDDGTGTYKKTSTYTGALQYVYLFGYAVENKEVTVTVTSADTTNEDELDHRDVSVGGIVRGHRAYAKYVNVYTIKVEFNLNAEFSVPNCHWSGVSAAQSTQPREFILEIEKLGVDRPTIQEDTTLVFTGDEIRYTGFTYDGADNGPTLHVENCLSSTPIWFMKYDYKQDRTKINLDEATKILDFTILNRAQVGVEYLLTISVDPKNAYWIDSANPTDTTDVADKKIYIEIQPKGITKPEVFNEGLAGGTYTANSVKFTYNGSTRPADLKIKDVDTGIMTFAVSSSADMPTPNMVGAHLVSGTNNANSNTYSVTVSLKDKTNYKWAGTTNDVSDVVCSLIIDPVRIAKPEFDQTYMTTNGTFDTVSGTFNSIDTCTWDLSDTDNPKLTVVYYRDSGNEGLPQYIIVKNFVNDAKTMSFDQPKAFEKADGLDTSDGLLKFGSVSAGTYQLRIRPTQNTGWTDGTSGDVVFTLVIEKKENPTAKIKEEATPPATTVSTDGLTRTVTYRLDAATQTKGDWQTLIIEGIDHNILQPGTPTSDLGTTVTDRELVQVSCVQNASGTYDYTFKALKAGKYTVPFSFKNGMNHNEYLDYDTTKAADKVVYTFIINKLSLATPEIDSDTDMLLNGEARPNATTYTAVYDATRHATLVLNVRGKGYMTYGPVDENKYDYTDGTNKDDFYYSLTPTATSELTSTPTYETIDNIFNKNNDWTSGTDNVTKKDGSFTNASVLVANQLDRKNFILMHAGEPGSYELKFTLADTENMVWAGGTTTDKTVKLVVNKKLVAAPIISGTNTKAYTGNIVEFEIGNIFGMDADGLTYTPNAPAIKFESISFVKNNSSDNKSMKAVELDTSTNKLTIEATDIGTYTVTVSIKPEETKHFGFITTGATSIPLTFKITMSTLAPTVSFVNPEKPATSPATGWVTDTLAAADFAPPTFNYTWAISSRAYGQITIPNINVKRDASGNPLSVDIDSSLAFDVYYVDTADPTTKLSSRTITPWDDLASPSTFFSTLPTAATPDLSDTTTDNNGEWTIHYNAGSPVTYDLIYTFLIEPDPAVHTEAATGGRIPMANYVLHVDQNNPSVSNQYIASSASKNFAIKADPAPFEVDKIYEHIIWERYLVSDPNKATVQTYTLADLRGQTGMTSTSQWTDMTAAQAFTLPFLEDNDSYGFRFSLDAATMGSEKSVRTVLNNLKVDWDTTYVGKDKAKYSGQYRVGVTISALNPKEYSFTTTTYEFYYEISKVRYDLAGLTWDYSGTPFTYDGNAHSVKLVGTLPAGLSIASYTVTGYDGNSQVSAKYDSGDPTNTTTNYYTTVVFANANNNYQLPDVTNNLSYLDSSGNFSWTVVWGIQKANITANWTSKMTGDGSATMSIPRLDAHGEKVNYAYYRDNGDPNPLNWDPVTTFEHTGNTDFFVVPTLKSNPSNPETDYANNYTLTVSGSNFPAVTNGYKFTLAPGAVISIDVEVDGVVLAGGQFATLPTTNIFTYDGTVTYSATVTITGIGCVSSLTTANLAVTYYSTANKYKSIPAPTTPGHYLIKIQLKDIPATDTNEYELSDTEFYFDVEKGDFNSSDIYWRYTHTDNDGNVIEARYDFGQNKWLVHSAVDSNGDPIATPAIGSEIKFEYDGKAHNVELISDDPNLVITTKNRSHIDAGKYFNTSDASDAAIASFSFNGKLWNSPASLITNVMNWEIEKAEIDLSSMSWKYAAPYVYTISGEEEKSFTVTMDNIPDLIATFVTYRTFNLGADGVFNGFDSDGKLQGDDKELDTHVLTKAGKYRTVFSCKDFLNEETNAALLKNYKVDNESLAEQILDWEIEVRKITVPSTSGSWTVYDGQAHDLRTAVTLPSDWAEYLTISAEYSANTTTPSYAAYDGTGFYGDELFAEHAGNYRYTFKLRSGLNVIDSDPAKSQINVQFNVPSNEFDPQNYVITVAKAKMTIDYWNSNDEASTVSLSGAFVSYEFIDYKFTTEPAPGTEVPVSDVTASSGVTYRITVYVKDDYTSDVELEVNNPAPDFLIFTTLPVSGNVTDQFTVVKQPYIEGYVANDVTHTFKYAEWKALMLGDAEFKKTYNLSDSEDFDWRPFLGEDPDAQQPEAAQDATVATPEQIAAYKAEVRVNVTYGGYPITFKVYNWDNYYSNYMYLWKGGLYQSQAGDYSVTYMLNKNATNPLCWSYNDADNDGVLSSAEVNRDPVELKYRISFKMIPIPEITDPTYTGSPINVLKTSLGTEGWDKWSTEYGMYVEITGEEQTLAGSYSLKLKIKDEFLSTIHWDNDTPTGQPGTHTIKWKVLPIYISIPVFDNKKTITYDGNSHSIYEKFEGYNGGEYSPELKALMQLAQISGDNGVNAGSYDARFKLPDSNYAWKSTVGDTTVSSSLMTFNWTIERKKLDMSDISWNYDEKKPFQYTVDNGDVQEHTIELENIPEELKEFITYVTDGTEGNVKSDMGKYRTVVYFFQKDAMSMTNYTFVGAPQDFLDKYKDPAGNGYVAIDWEITERRFAIPKDTDVEFDGTVRDLLVLFGFEEGWENYLDATVEYKPLGTGDDKYKPYSETATVDELLNYSIFNVFYLGNYRVEFTIKSELNATADCVVWYEGGNKLTTKQNATLTVNPLTLTVDGWTTETTDGTPDDEWTSAKGDYKIVSAIYDSLSDDSKEIFEYVIRDEATGEIVTMSDVISRGAGIMYTVEFVIKEGNDYAMAKGIEIVCAAGTENPFTFTNVEFPGNPNPQTNVVFWLPIPELVPVTFSDVYDGKDKVYTVNGWTSNYIMDNVDPSFRSDILTNYGIDLTSVEEFLVPAGKYAQNVNLANGEITLRAAGDAEVIMRLAPNLNLSWYDPTQYTFDVATKQLLDNTSTPVTGAALDALIDRAAKKLEISIKKAAVERITNEAIEMFESMIPVFEHTGSEYNLKEREETKALFAVLEEKYGALITFDGYRGTAAGDYKLIIKLSDPSSSYWDLKETETLTVNKPDFAEYDSSYVLMYESDTSSVIKYMKPDGKGGYIDYNGGNYTLDIKYKMSKVIDSYVDSTGLLDGDGKPETASGAKYVTDENGVAIRYKLEDGVYTEDPAGTLIAKYKLRADGSVMEMPDLDSFNRQLIDGAASSVTITRAKTSTDPYEVKWMITSGRLSAPTLNENVKLYYSGGEQSVEKALTGYNGTFMEIVEGGKGTDAGEYTAKIKIKDDNYKWIDGIADENGLVSVVWKIEKATIDLSNVSWKFTDGEKNYDDGIGMIYTRKGDKAVVYWAELDNLPEAVKGAIRYTTNGVMGAYAGKNAGKYVTSFEIVDSKNNFEPVTIPETLATTVTWNIQRRYITAPSADGVSLIFDDKPHDLLEMLGVSEDWEQYYTINVQYAQNFTTYHKYDGYEGDPYTAFGAGAYKFTFDIVAGINTDASNPSVAWIKGAAKPAEPEVPDVEQTEEVVPKSYKVSLVSDRKEKNFYFSEVRYENYGY